MNNVFSVQKIDKFEEFLKLDDIWNEFLAKSEADYPFLTFEWISTWWKYFREKNKLFILLIRENGLLKAIAPLMLVKRSGINILEFIGTSRSDYLNFIISKNINRDEAIRLFLEFLKNKHSQWDILNLKDMQIKEPDNALFKDFPGFSIVKMADTACPYLEIKSNWNDYLAGKSSKDRNNIKRWERVINKSGKVGILKVENGVPPKELLQQILGIEAKSWKVDAGNPRLLGEKATRFFEDIFEKFNSNKWLELWFLSLDEKPITYMINFYYKNKIYFYNIAYDKDYAKSYPGVHLISVVLQDSFKRQVDEYDFLRGDESYKYFWTQTSRPLYQIVVYQRTLKSKLSFMFLFKLRWFFRKYAFFKKLNALKVKYSYKLKTIL